VSWRRRPPTGSYAAPIRAATTCQQAGMDTRRRCVFLPCLQGLHLAASELKALRPGTSPSVLAHLPWLAFVRSPCPGPSSAGTQSATATPLVTPPFSDTPTPQPPTASGPALSLRSCSTRATAPCTGIAHLTAPHRACTATGLHRPPPHRRPPLIPPQPRRTSRIGQRYIPSPP
jgi:hypothetical protein